MAYRWFSRPERWPYWPECHLPRYSRGPSTSGVAARIARARIEPVHTCWRTSDQDHLRRCHPEGSEESRRYVHRVLWV